MEQTALDLDLWKNGCHILPRGSLIAHEDAFNGWLSRNQITKDAKYRLMVLRGSVGHGNEGQSGIWLRDVQGLMKACTVKS